MVVRAGPGAQGRARAGQGLHGAPTAIDSCPHSPGQVVASCACGPPHRQHRIGAQLLHQQGHLVRPLRLLGRAHHPAWRWRCCCCCCTGRAGSGWKGGAEGGAGRKGWPARSGGGECGGRDGADGAQAASRTSASRRRPCWLSGPAHCCACAACDECQWTQRQVCAHARACAHAQQLARSLQPANPHLSCGKPANQQSPARKGAGGGGRQMASSPSRRAASCMPRSCTRPSPARWPYHVTDGHDGAAVKGQGEADSQLVLALREPSRQQHQRQHRALRRRPAACALRRTQAARAHVARAALTQMASLSFTTL